MAGLAKLLDIRTFYYHLKEDCQADMAQVKAVKRTLGNMRHQIHDLQEQLTLLRPGAAATRNAPHGL